MKRRAKVHEACEPHDWLLVNQRSINKIGQQSLKKLTLNGRMRFVPPASEAWQEEGLSLLTCKWLLSTLSRVGESNGFGGALIGALDDSWHKATLNAI